MSSPEDGNESDSFPAPSKSRNGDKKKRPRACDLCRRRKVRCDGNGVVGTQCTNCKAYDYKCAYAPKKRAVDPDYLHNLETQLAEAQEALRKLSAAKSDGADSQRRTSSPHESSRSSPSSTSSAFLAFQTGDSAGASTTRMPPFAHVELPDVDPSDDEFVGEVGSTDGAVHMVNRYGHRQFIGKSGSILLLQQALNMREAADAAAAGSGAPQVSSEFQLGNMCRSSWDENPWLAPPTPCQFKPEDFPDPAFLADLVDAYFATANLYFPLLNRIIFDRGIADNLHLRDDGFGSTVLLVCAIGARKSTDRRVLLDGYDKDWKTAGWKWYQRVQDVRKLLSLRMATLYDLQIPALAAIFLYTSPTPNAAATLVAYGLRQAMDLGAHKRKMYLSVPNVDDELLKRAFWVLVVVDRKLSTILGRPCSIQDEDYDVELPLECDDEFWFSEHQPFKQPKGRPSLITAFNCLVRLEQIQGSTLRTIYATNKSKALWGIGDDMQMVALLDSALNKWIDSIPDHLRWDPSMTNETYLQQSALLYSSYYHLQISIHRSFIPIPSKSSSSPLPSLMICTNAARACVHVLEVQFRKSAGSAYQNLIALFNAGIVLVLNIWANKHSGAVSRFTKDLEDIEKVIQMLKTLEPRIYVAGRVIQCLREIAAIGDIEFTDGAVAHLRGTKRTRDTDIDATFTPPSARPLANGTALAPSSRAMAGSQRVQQARASLSSFASAPPAGAFHPPQPHQHQQQPTWLGSTPASAPWGADFPLAAAGEFYSPPTSSSSGHECCGPRPDAAAFAPTPPDVHGACCPPPQTGFQPAQATDDTFGPMLDVPAYTAAHGVNGVNGLGGLAPDGGQWGQLAQQQQSQQSTAVGMDAPMLDSDLLAMLSSAPMSLEWHDWGTYITNLTDVDNVRDISAGVSQL